MSDNLVIAIKNGHVSNCRDGIVIITTEDSKVMNMTSTGNTQWWDSDREAWVLPWCWMKKTDALCMMVTMIEQ